MSAHSGVGFLVLALTACSTNPQTPPRCMAAYAPTEPTLLLRYRRTGAVGDAPSVAVDERLEVEQSTDRLVRLRFGEGTSRGVLLVRSCDAPGLEDPYIGWLPAQGAEQQVQGRMPAELREGISWETSVRLSWPSLPGVHADARRHYVTEAVERVTVPAGTFDAWRIAFDEQAGEHAAHGRIWLDRDVGLVRLERNGEALVTEELIAIDHVER